MCCINILFALLIAFHSTQEATKSSCMRLVRGTLTKSSSLRKTLTHDSLSGQDATDAFEDVGHSDEARALLPGMLVGQLDGAVRFESNSAIIYRAQN